MIDADTIAVPMDLMRSLSRTDCSAPVAPTVTVAAWSRLVAVTTVAASAAFRVAARARACATRSSASWPNSAAVLVVPSGRVRLNGGRGRVHRCWSP